jgi:hypothetical protein
MPSLIMLTVAVLTGTPPSASTPKHSPSPSCDSSIDSPSSAGLSRVASAVPLSMM